VYAVEGPITMGESSARLAEGDEALARGESEFSLKRLAGSDSSALAVLLAWRRRAQQRNGSLSFVEVPQSLATLAGLYGVEPFLPGFPEVTPPGTA
jgi:phospholipid transport system transporter-binding protein